MKIHELKILPQYFEKVLDGSKTFELRKDDRGFEVGDILILKEFNEGLIDHTKGKPITIQEAGYTGRTLEREICYIFKGGVPRMGLRTGFCILALKDKSKKNMIERSREEREFRKKIKVKCKEEHSICEVHNGKLKVIAVVDEGEEYAAVLNEETEEYFARNLEGREFIVGEIRFDKDLKMDKLVLSEEFELVEEMNELEKYIKE